MLRYFRSSIINIKNIIVIVLFILLTITMTLAFMNLGEPYIEKVSFASLYNESYKDKILLASKILMFSFIGIMTFDHDSKSHIPIIVKKGRIKFYLSKLIFWIIFNLIIYLVMFSIVLISSRLFAVFFSISKDFLLGYLRGFFDVLLLTLLILTFIRDDTKAFTFIFVGVFLALLLLFKSFGNELFIYKYLIPISESPIYKSAKGYMFFIPYILSFITIYFLKVSFEQIKF